MAISSIANLQLSVMQLPEVAREEVPILASTQLANAQAPAIIARQDRDASETVQSLEQLGSGGVSETPDRGPRRERPAYSEHPRSPRLGERRLTLAAAHPFGVGLLIDVSA